MLSSKRAEPRSEPFARGWMRPYHRLRPIIEDLARAKRASARRRCRPCGPMENAAGRRRALACWQTGRRRECDRAGHPEPGRKAPWKNHRNPCRFSIFQLVSCSDDVRGSTRHPAQSTGHARTQGGPRKRGDAGGGMRGVRERDAGGGMRGVRERTLAFIEKTSGGDLSKYRMAHPFLGSLNAYQWLQFLAAHEKRHRKYSPGRYRKRKQVCISRTFLPLCWPLLSLRTTQISWEKVQEKAWFSGL